MVSTALEKKFRKNEKIITTRNYKNLHKTLEKVGDNQTFELGHIQCLDFVVAWFVI